ncbi:NADH dehydrogenase [Aaosphaeria arxii CBS 175.79]|uniref:NADH dehydrogenase n=1 Tax=Aaosphaeria arxii CBS 175.79 TaxID=1450172 RepID=A0A6A5XCV3_9PLEO|nr:NADH dehydrogenase [Aaosphaeria arxii CBS 175.79]KAF2010731.1 NADH dehydrogenase [Aaosphaeria arxii CBS 175.79]
MKHATACPECRVTKIRCTQDPGDPQSACLTCQRRNIKCSRLWKRPKVYTTVPWTGPNTCTIAPPADLPQWDRELRSLTPKEISHFIQLYFKFVHDRPHSLFQEWTFWEQYHSGTLSDTMLAALCALGCRLSLDEAHRNLSTFFISKAKSLISQNLEDISISNVQACILLANSYAAEQNHKLEGLYFGIANRMAYILGLHKQDNRDLPILKETKCRIWWSLFMADRWCTPGLGLPREIPFINRSMELPMDERDFQLLRPADELSFERQRNGLWAYNITLVDIVDEIQDMNLSLTQDYVDRPTVDAQVQRIEARLQDWHNSLPLYMIMNEPNLERYRKQGTGGLFVGLHLGYHYFHTLLYFQYLEPNCEPNPRTIAYASKCRSHGLSFSRLLWTARGLGDCHVVFLTVAHMTIVSSSVLLHLLLFGNPEEVDTAKLQLTRNFEALMELSKYWPRVDKMKDRLFVFQEACLRSSAASTYTVNRWVVRFLLEYALPFERNGTDEDTCAATAAVFKHSPSSSNVPLERRIMLDKALEDLRN